MQMEASECTMCTSPAAPTDHHSVLEWQLARLVGLQQHSAGNGNGNAIDHSKGGAKAITGSSSKERRKPEDSTKPAMVDATTTNASGNEIMASTATPNPNSSSSGKKKAASSKESTAVPRSGTPPAAKPDYIHVRARRGQATDSHSLAERVRRERISERMRYLQGLVPACSKSTGKAGMLDEIINYVQSLQRQVEFLSMKLAFVNPLMDSSTDDFMSINPAARVEAMSYLQVSSLQQAELPHQVIDPFPGSCLSVHGSNSAWSVSLHKNYALETQQSRGATMPSQFSQCI